MNVEEKLLANTVKVLDKTYEALAAPAKQGSGAPLLKRAEYIASQTSGGGAFLRDVIRGLLTHTKQQQAALELAEKELKFFNQMSWKPVIISRLDMALTAIRATREDVDETEPEPKERSTTEQLRQSPLEP